MPKKTEFVKRTAAYWLICGGKHPSSGKEAGAVINPGTEHYHRVKPYAVRCVKCAQIERIA